MAETRLVPYTEFDKLDLARRLNTLVSSERAALLGRHFIGLTQRYGNSLGVALESVQKGRRVHSNWERRRRDHEQVRQYGFSLAQSALYAIVWSESGRPDSQDVVGAASIQPQLPLDRFRLPLERRVARFVPFSMARPTPGWDRTRATNIRAWTTQEVDGRVLAQAYRDLEDTAVDLPANVSQTIWTTEPEQSPTKIHAAILDSHLEHVGIGIYDDFEDSRTIPPLSILYAASTLIA